MGFYYRSVALYNNERVAEFNIFIGSLFPDRTYTVKAALLVYSASMTLDELDPLVKELLQSSIYRSTHLGNSLNILTDVCLRITSAQASL